MKLILGNMREFCEEWKVEPSDEVIDQLASTLGNDVSSYGEAIQRVLSYSYLTGQEASRKMVKKICKELASER